MTTITVTSFDAASNTDILQGGRLQNVPSNGVLTFEIQAADNVAANNFTFSIQLPSGATPCNGVLAPGSSTAGLAGLLDSRLSYKASFRVAQGGHCVYSCVETGDTELFSRVTFQST